MATRDIVTSLYNGTVTVTYRNGNHRYYVNDVSVPSVTTIMSRVIAKPDLMLWPLNLAISYLEEKLPNITSEDLQMARTAHVRKRDHGTNTGTAVHHLVERRLEVGPKGYAAIPEDLPTDVRVAAYAFETWYRAQTPQVIGIEQIVYSPSLNFVGTYDSILEIDGKVYLCDVKTTNASSHAPLGIYPENFIQLSAYYAAYEEQRKAEGVKTKLVPIDDLMVISVKKNGAVDTMTASSIGLTLKQGVKIWKAVMGLHAGMVRLKTSVGGVK